MLLRFGCSNHLSIRSFQEISFIASALKDDNGLFINIPASRNKALACSAIYGANASGKSNYLRAFLFMQELVVESHVELKPKQEISNIPFLLAADALNEPTHFECDFIGDGTRYSYGFSILRHRIRNEFLYAYPRGHKQIWFSRDEEIGERFVFGKNLRGRNSIIGELTRPNSLFLSAAAQQNHEQLGPVYAFFAEKITSSSSHPSMEIVGIPKLLESEKKDWVVKFLKSADVGISESRIDSDPMPDEARDLWMFITERFFKKEDFPSTSPKLNFEIKKVSLGHSASGGKLVFLPFESESSGTQKMLSLLVPVLSALDRGGIAIIDEIDASLHTLVATRLVELFKNPNINSKGAQLLFTTHDTNLLCSGILRRDEIWFSEKNHEGETHIYPLSDFKTRGTDNLQKGYLQGRFGALPFMGTIEDLLA